MKRKCRTEAATAEPMDPDLWIRDAHAANDDEAVVAWLTRMRATNTTQDEQAQKRRRLDVDARRWEQYKTTSDRLAKEHAQRAHDTYHIAGTAEVTRQHLCTLHAFYSNTLTAKTDYHMLVAKPRGGRLLGPGTRPPPPLRALRAHLVTKGQWLLTIHMVAPKAPENFFSFPLPT